MARYLVHNPSSGFRKDRQRWKFDAHPVPTIMGQACGIGGDNISHWWIEEDGVPESPVATDKPPYRVPSMEEIAKVRGTNGLTVVSTFSGCGGSCLGFEMAGYQVLWASEFVPAAREVYALNHPGVILDDRDIREVRPEEVLAAIGKAPGEVDVLEGSPPCFPAGTTVVCGRGVVAIEDVQVGDVVLTHRGRWRRVSATMSREAETVVAIGGRLEATADHPVWSRPQERYKTGERYRPDASHPKGSQVVRWRLGEAEWVPAAGLHGRFVATPASCEPLPIPPPPVGATMDFWWVVGRWLGDGWVRIAPGDVDLPWKKRTLLSPLPRDCPVCGSPARRSTRYPHLFGLYCNPRCKQKAGRDRRVRPRYEVHVCCSHPEADKLGERLAATGLRWARSEQESTVRFTTGNKALALWLVEHFGRGAAGKTLPGWMLGAAEDERRAVLDGYVSADGHDLAGGGWTTTSVSHCLTIGIQLLAVGLGLTTSTGYRAKNTGIIEGRTVTTRPSWQLTAHPDDDRYTRLEGGHRWTKVRRQTVPGRRTTVYDLTVEDDASFVANGLVVHNCASFSTAGKRQKGWGQVKSYSDTEQRSDDLFFEYARLLRGIQPRAFVAENVSGLVKGVAKGYFLEILKALKDCGYRVEARLLDAQWLGVPQARKRIIFVGVRNDLERDPAFPSPLPYRYSIRDALPWLSRVTHDTSGQWSTGVVTDRPSPTVTVGVNSVNSNQVDDGLNEPRTVDRPSPTIRAGRRQNLVGHVAEEVVRVGVGGGYGNEKWQTVDEPARTLGATPVTGNGRCPPGVIQVRRIEQEEPECGWDAEPNRPRKATLDDPMPTVLAQGRGFNQVVVEVPGRAPESMEGYAVGEEWDKLRPGESSDKYFNLVKPDQAEPVPTVTAHGGTASLASVTHPTEKRKFTIAELRRLCAFPDSFQLTGSYAQQWERLGRAVPPVMMRAVAEALRDGPLRG